MYGASSIKNNDVHARDIELPAKSKAAGWENL